MTEPLEKLIQAAKTIQQSKIAAEEQRRSFVYGNTNFENQNITRRIINEQAEAMKKAL